MVRQKQWSDLSGAQQAAVILGGAVEVVLTGIALIDLVRRSPDEVRGPKALWGLALVIQPVGPLAYLVLGRTPAPAPG